jgi:hypothetical protein
MAIYRGLNVFLYLSDVDNLNEALINLGLNINDLNRIRGLSDSITEGELHLLGGLVDDNEKETYSLYRSAFQINSKINSLRDIYSAEYDSNLIINNQLRASAIKYNFLEFKESWPRASVKQADISTSRVSSWSSIEGPYGANTIFYGAELEVNPFDPGTGQHFDANSSVIYCDNIKFNGPITPKRFAAEVPTNKIKLNINGTDTYFYTMKNIPLTFEGFFRQADITFVTDGVGAPPTLVVLDYTTTPASEFVYPLLPTTVPLNQDFSFTTNGRKRIDFYYRPDGIRGIGLPSLNIRTYPQAILNALEFVNLYENALDELPDFRTYGPSLRSIIVSGNPFSNATNINPLKTGNAQLQNLPDTLRYLDISGTFQDNEQIDISYLPALQNFIFRSYWSRGNFRRNIDINTTPIIGANTVVEYDVTDQSYRYVPNELLQPNITGTLNDLVLFNNNIQGARSANGGGTNGSVVNIEMNDPLVSVNVTDPDTGVISLVTVPDHTNNQIIKVDLGQNSCVPIPFGGPDANTGSSNIETYIHHSNFAGARANINGYYTYCSGLRYVDFHDSYVQGEFIRVFEGCTSLTTVNLENTRMSGTFQGFAVAATNFAQQNPDGSQRYAGFLLNSLAEFKFTVGSVNTQVDTTNNYFGNALESVVIASGNDLFNTFAVIRDASEEVKIRIEKNSTLNRTWFENSTGTTDLSQTIIITAQDFSSDMGLNYNADFGFFNTVAGKVSGDITQSSSQEAVYAIADVTNDGDNGNNNGQVGVVGLYGRNGQFITKLNPVPTNNNLFGYDNFDFGYSLAVTGSRAGRNDKVFVGWPGKKNSNFSTAGGVEVFNWRGSRITGSSSNSLTNLPQGLINSRTRFGEKVVADDNYIFVLEPGDGNNRPSFIAKFLNNNNLTFSTTPIFYQNNQNRRRRISDMRQSAQYLAVGIPARVEDDGQTGRVEIINKAAQNTNDNIVATILPASTAPTSPGGVNLQGYYESNFGWNVDIIEGERNGIASVAIAVSSPIPLEGDGATSEGYGSTIEIYDLNGNLVATTGFSTTPNQGNGATRADEYSENLKWSLYRDGAGDTHVILTSYIEIGGTTYAHSWEWDFQAQTLTTVYDSGVETGLSSADFVSGETIQLDNQFEITSSFERQSDSQCFKMTPNLDTLKLGQSRGIAGKLPNFQFVPDMRNLEIFGTSLTGTVNLNQMEYLESVKLNDNKFTGLFPDHNLSYCRILFINQNQFTALGDLNMDALEYFDCSSNIISGPVPSFAFASNVKDVDFSNNKFNEYVAGTFATCLSLRKIVLSNNQLTLFDGFRILDDMVTNYNNNNRAGVSINMLGNTNITENQINQNPTYAGKLNFLRNIAGWTVLVNQ